MKLCLGSLELVKVLVPFDPGIKSRPIADVEDDMW